VVCGLQQPDAGKFSLRGSIENRLHQPAPNPQILDLGVYGDRANAGDWGALVKEVAADNFSARFRNNAEEARVRQQHRDQTGRDVHGREVGRKIMLARNAFKRLEANSAARTTIR
jgi:hypothetical protein